MANTDKFTVKDGKGGKSTAYSNMAAGSKATPKKPKKPTSVFPTYESTAALRGKGGATGAPLTRVYPATPPANPMQDEWIADLLSAVNGGSAAPGAGSNPLTNLFNQVNAGAAPGAGSPGAGSGGGGGAGSAGSGAPTGAGYQGGDVQNYTYQDRFGGSTGDYTSGYTPAGLNEMNQSGNYDVLVAGILADAGITNPETIAQFAELAKYGGLIDMIAGGDPSSGASVNFIGDYVNQMMTPGGAVPTFDELVGYLLGDTGTDEAASLQANIGVNDLNNYILDLLDSVGGNQYYQRAMYGSLNSNQRDYNATRYRGGEQGTYAEYLRQNGLYG